MGALCFCVEQADTRIDATSYLQGGGDMAKLWRLCGFCVLPGQLPRLN